MPMFLATLLLTIWVSQLKRLSMNTPKYLNMIFAFNIFNIYVNSFFRGCYNHIMSFLKFRDSLLVLQ